MSLNRTPSRDREALADIIVEALANRRYIDRIRDMNPAVTVESVRAAFIALLTPDENPDIALANRMAEDWAVVQAAAMEGKKL